MMMKTAPGTSLEVVQTQVILEALKVLLDMPARTAQFQAAGFRRGLVQVSQVIVIRFRVHTVISFPQGRPQFHLIQ